MRKNSILACCLLLAGIAAAQQTYTLSWASFNSAGGASASPALKSQWQTGVLNFGNMKGKTFGRGATYVALLADPVPSRFALWQNYPNPFNQANVFH